MNTDQNQQLDNGLEPVSKIEQRQVHDTLASLG